MMEVVGWVASLGDMGVYTYHTISHLSTNKSYNETLQHLLGEQLRHDLVDWLDC